MTAYNSGYLGLIWDTLATNHLIFNGLFQNETICTEKTSTLGGELGTVSFLGATGV